MLLLCKKKTIPEYRMETVCSMCTARRITEPYEIKLDRSFYEMIGYCMIDAGVRRFGRA